MIARSIREIRTRLSRRVPPSATTQAAALFLLLIFLPVIALTAWARVTVRDHTTNQVVAGAMLGAIVAGIMFGSVR